ncbi:MAG TPA: hypothetical protein VGE00_10180 [Gammaproteobacteria bacterium]
MFSKPVRVTILLLLLAFVAASSWLTRQRTTRWEIPLWAVVYPINGDGSELARQHIATLTPHTFAAIETFFSEEAARYGLPIERPVEIKLAPPIGELPPAPPADGNMFKIVAWSLQMRWWAWRHNSFDGPVDLKLYVIYHTPQPGVALPHSLGLQKGLIGVAHIFADPRQDQTNNVVISHELLHLVGASDKYEPATNQPRYPEGYAEPELTPLLPQRFAELMGGRIPVTETKAAIPPTLDSVLIGELTAKEIRWIK